MLVGRTIRGGEVLLIEASDFVRRHLDGKDHPNHPNMVIPLMGWFKNEVGEQNLLLTLASETQSGITIQKWVEQLIILLIREGRSNQVRPAICERDGFLMERWKINGIFHEALARIQAETNLIPNDINVSLKYSMHCSARRGMYTRVREAKVPDFIIKSNMRWSKFQNCSGGMPNRPMTELYLEIS